MFFGYDYFPFVPRIPNTNEEPPTIYATKPFSYNLF